MSWWAVGGNEPCGGKMRGGGAAAYLGSVYVDGAVKVEARLYDDEC